MTTSLIIGFVVRLLVSALLLWTAIKICDRHNTKNTLGAAVGWSLIIAGGSFLPLFGLVLGLVVFFMVCFRYYEMGVLQSICALLAQVGMAYGLGFLLMSLSVGAA